MLNQRLLKNLDYSTIVVTAILVFISLIIIGSATHINTPSDDRYWYVQRQGISALLNVLIVFFMLHFDHRSLGKVANLLYGLNIVCWWR